MNDTWETTVRTAATTMLRYPNKISDGLEAELYALLEKLGGARIGAQLAGLGSEQEADRERA